MQRRPRQYHSTGIVVFLDLSHELAVEILQSVTFINNDVAPIVVRKMNAVLHDHLISGDDNRE